MNKDIKRGSIAISGLQKGVRPRWRVCVLPAMVVMFCLLGFVAAGMGGEEPLVEKLRLESTSMRGEKLQVSLVLRAIGRKAGVNVLVNEAIADTISFDLEDVSLYDLFHLVLNTKGLRFYEANRALVVEKAADFKKDQRDMVTTRLCPRYGQATSHMPELAVLKSEEGNLTVSANGNCLVVHDHEANVEKIAGLLKQLDISMTQVHIKARIVTIDKTVSKELGIKWGYTDLSKLPKDSLTSVADMSILNPAGSMVFGFIRDTFTLDVELTALQKRNQLHILSEPRVVVLDGQEAEIKQGKEVPYESGTAENRNTSFREAVLGLKVVPKILQDNFIRLDVKVTNDSVDENNTQDGQPLLNRQEIRTNLFLEDGVTVVIGGILAKGTDSSNRGIPWFADLPLIGDFFKSTDDTDRTFELLVFLTPTLLKGHDHAAVDNKNNNLLDAWTEQGGGGGVVSLPAAEQEGRRATRAKLLLHPLETMN
jgi:type IV pilus assembly protein PilQ